MKNGFVSMVSGLILIVASMPSVATAVNLAEPAVSGKPDGTEYSVPLVYCSEANHEDSKHDSTSRSSANKMIEDIVRPMINEKYKDITSADDLLYFNSNGTEDCRLYEEKLKSSMQDVEEVVLVLREAKLHNNINFVTKAKAILGLKYIFSYALLVRPFTPKHCVDAFEEVELPRIEAIIDSVEKGTENTAQN